MASRLSVRVHPGARRNQLTGIRDGLVDAGVTARDAGGEANDIIIRLLSHRLRVGAEAIAIVSGEQSRIKQVRVETLGQSELDARLHGLGAAARRRRGRQRVTAAAVVAVGLAAGGILIAVGFSNSASQRASLPRRQPSVVAGHGIGHAGAARPTVRSGIGPRRHTNLRPRTARRRAASAVSRSRPDPGSLPQTAQRPSARTHAFAARMRGLWAAIAGAPIGAARAAFFPEAAYVQLKSIADPAGDFQYRLFYDYRLDIAAAHTLLGAGARGSHLIRTAVVPSYAHWVPPGICDNRVGYYEEPNARLVYLDNGQVRSIGIASLISWRGVWYVVHLGAILRGSGGGMVDAPSVGPGEPAYAGVC